MKKLFKLFTPIFLTPAFARLQRLNKKRAHRKQRIKEAYQYLHQWDDIPLSQSWKRVCEILEIEKNKAAYELVWRMNMDMGADDLEKIIPL